MQGTPKPPAPWPTPWPPASAICIVADYDCDGATACAVGVRGLRLLGAPMGFGPVDYLVPDRVTDGYGLTPPSPGA
jgi:single-stranded DNA-specific DHH superfamily exonuclease